MTRLTCRKSFTILWILMNSSAYIAVVLMRMTVTDVVGMLFLLKRGF